jgi:hypothetical protein
MDSPVRLTVTTRLALIFRNANDLAYLGGGLTPDMTHRRAEIFLRFVIGKTYAKIK